MLPQYLVLTLGDAKQATPTISKTLNPEWNFTLDLPITGVQSLLLEICCWDKDRFGKDYMGEFDVILEDLFQNVWGDKDVIELDNIMDVTVQVGLTVLRLKEARLYAYLRSS